MTVISLRNRSARATLRTVEPTEMNSVAPLGICAAATSAMARFPARLVPARWSKGGVQAVFRQFDAAVRAPQCFAVAKQVEIATNGLGGNAQHLRQRADADASSFLNDLKDQVTPPNLFRCHRVPVVLMRLYPQKSDKTTKNSRAV